MLRRALIAVLALAASLPAFAANKDMERLQLQVMGLQGQITDLQRVMEEHLRELKRLNEALAEQNAMVRRSVQEQKTQDESLQMALKDLTDRLAEVRERLQASSAPGYPAAPGLPEAAPGGPGTPYLSLIHI